MRTIFRRHIALPQDHGSWVFLFSPLAIGLAAGQHFAPASLPVILGAIAAFLLRQPITILIKIYTGRRSRSEQNAAIFWMSLYSLIGLLSLLVLLYLGFGFILLLGIPAVLIFACHLYLVSKRAERGQIVIELLATAALALVSPAAYWAAIAHYNPIGWWLWLLTGLQSAGSIVYVYLRLAQREWTIIPPKRDRFKAGVNAFGLTLFHLTLSLVLAMLGFVPNLIFLPYLLQFAETTWGIFNPASGVKPVTIGMRQLAVSTLFTLLFIFIWR